MAQSFDFLLTLSVDKENPSRVVVGLTLALAALTKKKSAAVLLLTEGVRVATKGYLEGVDVGAPFVPAPDLWESFLGAGGKVYVCGACMTAKGIAESDLAEGAEVVDGGGAVDLITEARSTLQFN